MKACVTGGAGFIGSHLAERLVAEGHEVVVLDDLSTGTLDHLEGVGPRLRFVRGDVRRPGDVEAALAGCEVVFHQAALASVVLSMERPREVTDVNVDGTLNVLIAARAAGVRRVVFASSSSVYGETATLPNVESMPTSPRSPYAATKVAAEALLQGFFGSFGLETVALRYFNVYGPRQATDSAYAAVVPAFLAAMRAGRPAVIHGDGTQTRDFTHVDDVVEANLRAAVSPAAAGTVLNVGGGRRVSILDLARALGDALGFEGAAIHAAARAGDVRDSLADIRRAQDLLGWEPRVSLERGIERLVQGARGGRA